LHRFEREEQKTDMYDQIKGRYNLVEEKILILFEKMTPGTKYDYNLEQ